MYEDYFGLERPPFKITPDTSLFYEGGKRGDILGALVYAIQRGEGIVKVVGEVGSGKTMLCRMLQLKLPDSVEIVYIANPSVSPEDILFVIAHELSLPVTRDASKHEVMHILQDYLLKRHMDNRQVVLFVEEAQGMPIETLEEIRLLSNLETDQNKLLQIILFGQPELDENLSQQSIRQLRERITHNFNLEPLTREEIHNYLNFRMREVGYTGPELINRALAKKVEQYSGGLLRRINIIADKILLSAFAEGTHNLSAKHVHAAVNDSAFNPSGNTRRGAALWWLALIICVALLFALYQTRPQWFSIQAWKKGATQQNAAINDKPITDIAPQEIQTAKKPISAVSNTAVNDVAIAKVRSDETATKTAQPEAELAIRSLAAGSGDKSVISSPPVESEIRQIETASQQSKLTSLQTQLSRETGQQIGTGSSAQSTVALVQKPEPGAERSTNPAPTEKAESENTRLPTQAGEQAAPVEIPTARTVADLTDDYDQWLNAKLEESREWLANLDTDKVSIQVFVRRKSAARELVYYLRNEWPLDLSKTYLYEVSIENRRVFRVFYNEYDSMALGKLQLEKLPDTVKVNSPYLHSVYRMQQALL